MGAHKDIYCYLVGWGVRGPSGTTWHRDLGDAGHRDLGDAGQRYLGDAGKREGVDIINQQAYGSSGAGSSSDATGPGAALAAPSSQSHEGGNNGES